ncbi:hypothetical protein PPERSA_10664 [Pseudocohnilembus persalinus]|uniref:Uncharacterized protein n=1 Tax=Pseudocohnilembus persalinus TaxID=266149 RepID=A0A0V0QDJ4_PSEPJ|nr:hypothetical protein PPERSA_10664 [Pseudocohnilembus persalinus]|eukprot:KRX00165.1 hypothetical protein PPERSA_10664 [Pseudocohnilembus persalinus]
MANLAYNYANSDVPVVCILELTRVANHLKNSFPVDLDNLTVEKVENFLEGVVTDWQGIQKKCNNRGFELLKFIIENIGNKECAQSWFSVVGEMQIMIDDMTEGKGPLILLQQTQKIISSMQNALDVCQVQGAYAEMEQTLSLLGLDIKMVENLLKNHNLI